MANEPSWDDIFNPKPAAPAPVPAEPAEPAQTAPKAEDPALNQTDPSTQAYPTHSVASQAAPAFDPFADLFSTGQPGAAVVEPPSATPPVAPAADEYTPQAPFPVTATARFTPRADDDPFAALFGGSSAPESGAEPPAAAPASAPQSRREARESGVLPSLSDDGKGNRGSGSGGRGGGSGTPKKKRRLLWLKITLPIVLVLGAAGAVAAYGWFNYNEQVRELLGIPLPVDFVGSGNGEEVIVTIQSGDIGADIANTLHDQGVTMTFDAFYELLLEQETEPGFLPGNYLLEKEMSAQAALDALLDPESKVTDKLLITEGTVLPNALEIISETTGIPLEELQEASTDLASFGLPAEAPSLEGYLFPATYDLDGGMSAEEVLTMLVDTMFERLDAAGVAVEDRHTVLTMASIIQREAGSNPDDFYKVSRVFQNRIDQGMNLESDATVAYGTGNLDTVWTSDAERADAGNLYNTYANSGLPVGPIGLPGDLAIDAALNPVDGPWLFFVPVNLQTGETVFSETADQHYAAVEQLRAWCNASAENGAYCE